MCVILILMIFFWKLMELDSGGGRFVKKKVDCVGDVKNEFNADLVVNCTGIGSRELLQDSKVFGLAGTIVFLQPLIQLDSAFDYYDDEVNPTEKDLGTYVIPRKDAIIVGGTTYPEDMQSDNDILGKKLVRYLIGRINLLYF